MDDYDDIGSPDAHDIIFEQSSIESVSDIDINSDDSNSHSGILSDVEVELNSDGDLIGIADPELTSDSDATTVNINLSDEASSSLNFSDASTLPRSPGRDLTGEIDELQSVLDQHSNNQEHHHAASSSLNFSDASTLPRSPGSDVTGAIDELETVLDQHSYNQEHHHVEPVLIEVGSSPTNRNEEVITIQDVDEEENKPSVSKDQPKASPSGSRKRRAESDDEDDGQTCMICMEVWSNSGEHRMASLRCGHLFGSSCIMRWLHQARSKKLMRCPQCNKTASLKDVRILYAKKLLALDTVERDQLKMRLDTVEREKNKLELDLKKSQLTIQLQDKMLGELRGKLAEAESTQVLGTNKIGSNTGIKNLAQGDIRLIPEHMVEICKDGGCRVIACRDSLSLVVVSQRSANTLFSGYGISKMNSLNFRPTQFVFLHTKPIRDLAFHNTDNELLLSVSLDRCAKLLDISSNNVVQSFATPNPLWCCSWDTNDSNKFFVGSQNGVVIQYDMRQTGGPIYTTPSDVTPVTALVTLPSKPGGALPRGGFLACHLNSCRVYDYSNDGDFKGTQLPLDGPFTGMRYDSSTDHFLVSSRPSARSIRGKHMVCELDLMPDKTTLTCNVIQTLNGSTTQNLLSRPCQMKIPGYGSIVASHNESSHSIMIWNVANGSKVCSQAVRDPILDMCPITVNQTQYLGTVSEKTFRVFRVAH